MLKDSYFQLLYLFSWSPSNFEHFDSKNANFHLFFLSFIVITEKSKFFMVPPAPHFSTRMSAVMRWAQPSLSFFSATTLGDFTADLHFGHFDRHILTDSGTSLPNAFPYEIGYRQNKHKAPPKEKYSIYEERERRTWAAQLRVSNIAEAREREEKQETRFLAEEFRGGLLENFNSAFACVGFNQL